MVIDHKCMAHPRNIIATHEIGRGNREKGKWKKGIGEGNKQREGGNRTDGTRNTGRPRKGKREQGRGNEQKGRKEQGRGTSETQGRGKGGEGTGKGNKLKQSITNKW